MREVYTQKAWSSYLADSTISEALALPTNLWNGNAKPTLV